MFSHQCLQLTQDLKSLIMFRNEAANCLKARDENFTRLGLISVRTLLPLNDIKSHVDLHINLVEKSSKLSLHLQKIQINEFTHMPVCGLHFGLSL